MFDDDPDRTTSDRPSEADLEVLEAIVALLEARTGRPVSLYKRSSLLRRTLRRVSNGGFASAAAYLDALGADPEELDRLAQDTLVGVTSFLRDPEAWSAFREEAVPQLVARAGRQGSLRAWVPGCSSGEEAYSLAAMLLDGLQQAGTEAELEVFATDVDPKRLARARRGRFGVEAADHLPPRWMGRYFHRGKSEVTVDPSLRDRLLFARQDLLLDPPFPRLDLVSCRNVLIYLRRDVQQHVLEVFHRVQAPGGLLFLGQTETVGGELYTPVAGAVGLYARSETTEATPAHPPAEPCRSTMDADAARLIAELRTANAELRLRGERALSFNEELQAANEEHAAAKEELEALAEELEATNADLRRGVEEIRTAHTDWMNLIEATRIAALFLDNELRIRLVTPAMRAYVPVLDTDIGRPLSDLITRLPGIDLVALASEVLGSGDLLERECHPPHRWCAIRVAPYLGSGGTTEGVVVTVIDVTQLREAQTQQRRAGRLEAVGQLASGLAHDFNNLLSVMLGSLHLAHPKVSDPEVAALLDEAIQTGRRAASLTRRLLAFAQRSRLAPEPVDVNGLLQSLLPLLQRTLGDHIQVDHPTIGCAIGALVDPSELESAIVNLVVNARDAMPDGGIVRVSAQADGDMVAIEVADEGVGMDADIKERAFEPFFTTKTTGVHGGLGLSSVFGFANQSGGQLTMESYPGVGTSVRLHLPRVRLEERPTISSVSQATEGRSRHVLVVDDNPSVARLTARLIRRLGHPAAVALSPEDALEQLAEDPRIDTLVTDYQMPGLSGSVLASRARAIRPQLLVILTSGYAEPGVDIDIPFLQKPLDLEQLALLLTQADG